MIKKGTISLHHPFTLNHGSIELTFLVSDNLYFSYSQLKEQFTKTFPKPTEGFAGDEEPSSPAELFGKFLGFVSSLVDHKAPGQFDEILKLSLQEFKTRFLNNKDIHSFAVTLLEDDVQYPTYLKKVKENIIKNYYYAISKSNTVIEKIESNLLYQSSKGTARLVSIFGGQGNTEDFFEEFRELYNLYKSLIYKDFILPIAEKLNELVKSGNDEFDKIYTQGFDIVTWLSNKDLIPDQDYLLSVPVSCPLICIVQLCHYATTFKILGLTAGEFRDHFKSGVTGHSQGLITAVVIASSDTWKSFVENSLKAISIMFYIGSRCSITYPRTTLPPTMLQDSLDNNEGRPSPMLSIRDLTIQQVEDFISQTNKHLPKGKHIFISLINGAKNLVVSGPPESLYGLNLTLRKNKAPNGLDQSKIPFSKRKLKFSNRFLAIFAPFHSYLLENATDMILNDLKAQNIDFEKLKIKVPVFDTFNGNQIQNMEGSVVERVVKCITQYQVIWEKATNFDSTHILDFGPGGVSGLGVLTHKNKDGTGSRIIIAGNLDISPIDDEYGFKQEIFYHSSNKEIKSAQNWLTEFKPKLVKNANSKFYLDTKFSRLICRPPLMIPGMTPTTVNSDIVSAAMNAGYNIEVAGGGYFSAEGLENVLNEIVSRVSPGAGISINLIYVNPRMLQWGIPLIKELRSKGFPIQSLTIGAGIPSIEIATEYIQTLGLTYLGLKPGSIDSILQVISIAKANPDFPIVLQWTGGRGGGHHSYEDFHVPILQIYSKIRKCDNIVLIAGSGFGSDNDTYPYLTGSWSTKFNYPPMPFDGILFGSRVMTSKEAHTSLDAKKTIVECSGVSDSHWENTYHEVTGGIITVKSEMGEPIHKIGTRGVLLWKELDDTVFIHKKNKLIQTLNKKKDYIISRLNKDFQKIWFGKNSSGVCDLQDMTYQEVANRMIELMYVKKSSRWIDRTLRDFFCDILKRIEQRFTNKFGVLSIIQNYDLLTVNPQEFTDKFFKKFTLATEQLISEEDCDFFLMCASNPTQKPPPFVPVLDERFESFFKKDSLWQSEDLEAVVDEDVQRTCILHGPVSAQYINKINEPIGEILDSIHCGLIKKLIHDEYNDDIETIPLIECFTGLIPEEIENLDGVTISRTDKTKHSFMIGKKLPDKKLWFKLLAGKHLSWLSIFVLTDRIVQGNKILKNPLHSILSPQYNLLVDVYNPDEPLKTKLVVFEQFKGDFRPIVEIKLLKDNIIDLNLKEFRTFKSNSVSLSLFYKYNSEDGFTPILEIMSGRNNRIKEFYWKVWFGNIEKFDINIDVTKEILGDEIEITGQQISEFTYATGNKCEAFVSKDGKVTLAPMDFAIVIGWKSLIKSLFPKTVDGDLLKLVHLSNGYKMIPGAEPLKKGDIVRSKAKIKAVLIQKTGKLVRVSGTIYRKSDPVMKVISEFLFRGEYTDYENTFNIVTETPVQITFNQKKDLSVLNTKKWFRLEKNIELLNQTLTFRCESTYKYISLEVYSSIKTTGKVYLELPTKEIIQIGSVNYEAGKSYGNPVTEYLRRNGNTIEESVKFEHSIPISSGEELTSKAPGTNEPYANVSGDYNPIHVSRVFASYAELPGTITHGMYSSASIRSLVEEWAANNVASRVRAFKCNFVDMVLPNSTLQTTMEHIGMINGRKIIKFETKNIETNVQVLFGEAEIEQPITTYVFTGQGSQEQGMGMDLYNSSSVARDVWNRADIHFIDNYGFSILDIVQNNPTELTIHFGGAKGRKIRDNYIGLMFETISNDGQIKSERIFKDIDDKTESYTFVSESGLLSATQFTQPALTLMEKAAYEDMKHKGLIPSDVMFSGHSLGEYSALSSLANVLQIESLVDVVFYRGMTMQVAVPRDDLGRSNYGMCAVNPSRIHPFFNEKILKYIVEKISFQTSWLLEIVNYNVENQQYVAAGDLRSLDTLTNVLDFLRLKNIDFKQIESFDLRDQIDEYLKTIISECSKKSMEMPQPIELRKGYSVIPLKGISVPFHSSYLRSGVKPFQRYLCKKIPKSSVKPNDLIGKYIPNLTAKPFEITKSYFEEVYQLTKSEKIKNIIDTWSLYESD